MPPCGCAGDIFCGGNGTADGAGRGGKHFLLPLPLCPSPRHTRGGDHDTVRPLSPIAERLPRRGQDGLRFSGFFAPPAPCPTRGRARAALQNDAFIHSARDKVEISRRRRPRQQPRAPARNDNDEMSRQARHDNVNIVT